MAASAGLACPACGAAVDPADGFCEACGRELSEVAISTGAPAPPAACQGCGSPQISADGYCEQCGRKAPEGRDHVEIDLGVIAGVTDRGLRHYRNEDAMALAAPATQNGPAAVAVVCDGVSSSGRPDEASLAAADAGVRALLAALRSGASAADASERAIGAAGEAVAGLAGDAENSANAPATTYISAVITDGEVTLCWVGDSRAYWLPASPDTAAGLLTRDDSWGAELVTAGSLSEAEAAALPQSHVVTRWLGADAVSAAPHVATLEVTGPGVVLLCSDGLWNYCPAPAQLAELALTAALADPLGAAAALVTFAIEAGGKDNITVVLAPVPPMSTDPRRVPG
jgi:serine/threonine protein phosphatase PrpC